ncbi:thermonuclease family protein [Bdellovibrio sp. SKB1291214]|uniref:thermonuclease family protein n=1 Tax=Bdellovibrio sp. SKB1291214 TaxID=1732569 RepID=UPI000B51A7CA|nr:thermonuclease family protein [Bdellovibrio sp. SKB1291214]UYL10585.1 thermonuclease family protein [Bdellovibrio sp. SKB1291214]
MRFTSLILAVALSFSVFSAEAKKRKQNKTQFLSGVVEKCHDGDTCRVKVGNKIAKVRFAGIDCPELSQKYGKQARDFTESVVRGKQVNLECDGKSFDRVTCTVFIGDKNVNLMIVQNGWAYDSTKYSKGRYLASVDEARNQRLGIWSDNNLTSPYCYRHKTNKKCALDQSYMP